MSGISRHFGNARHFDDLSDSIALPTEPVRKPRQKGMTQKKLRERILIGHGIGHGKDYLP